MGGREFPIGFGFGMHLHTAMMNINFANVYKNSLVREFVSIHLLLFMLHVYLASVSTFTIISEQIAH